MLLGAADIAERLDITGLDPADLERRLPPAVVVYSVEMGVRTPLWEDSDVARVFGVEA